MVLSEFLQAGLKKILCIPLCAELHEGVEELRNFQNKQRPVVDDEEKVSVTTLMALMAANLAKDISKPCLVVLDAYFAVGPVFLALKNVKDQAGQRLLHVVTRAKNNAVAYEDPPPRTKGSGRPRKYGQKLKLISLFDQWGDRFQKTVIEIYGQQREVRYLCLDLLWKPVQEKIRFVLVADNGVPHILACSDLSLSASDIILAYSYRFKIEVNFKVMKHLMGVFFYHFWTSAWPRQSKKKKAELNNLSERDKKLIAKTTNAIEVFVNLGCIATGILQLLALNCPDFVWNSYRGWLRTVRSVIPAEETVRNVIQEEFFLNFRKFKNTATYRIIRSKNRDEFLYREDGSS